jgi:hypothetical protein
LTLEIPLQVRRRMGHTELWLCVPCWLAYRNRSKHSSSACRKRGCECRCRREVE